MVEEVGSERSAEDLVGALDGGPVVGRVLPVGLDVERGHVRLQALERRLLAARQRLRVPARRAQAELRVQHRRLEQVEARRQPVRAVLALQHHHRQRREGQARDHHARERARLLLRARREVEVAVALAGRRGCGIGCHIGAHRAAARRRARAGQFAFVVAVVRVRTPCVYSAGDAWVYSCVLEQ